MTGDIRIQPVDSIDPDSSSRYSYKLDAAGAPIHIIPDADNGPESDAADLLDDSRSSSSDSDDDDDTKTLYHDDDDNLHNWPRVYSEALGMLYPPGSSSDLKLQPGGARQGSMRSMSLCSGTDGPALATRMALGSGNVEHSVACDSAPHSQRFILENCTPEHFYKNTSFLNEKQSQCVICGERCEVRYT